MDPVSEMKLQIFSNQYYDFVDSFAKSDFESGKILGKYYYPILNGLSIDFDEDELRKFLYNNRKVINVTAKISIQVNEKPCGTIFAGRTRR